MKALIVISVVIIIISFCIYTIAWTVHRDMTREVCLKHGNGNFYDFNREYDKRKWKMDNTFRYSHFGVDECHSGNYIHAGIIRFNGVGMTLSYTSYWQFLLWKSINRKKKDSCNFNDISSDGDC